MNYKARFAVAAAALLAVVPLVAHHGTATSYDQTRWVTLKGKVTEFLWRNPHSALFLDVTDDRGQTLNYSIEMFSPGLMVGQGFTRKSMKKGDDVIIDVHPSLAGKASGECLGCKVIINGKEVVRPANAVQRKGPVGKEETK